MSQFMRHSVAIAGRHRHESEFESVAFGGSPSSNATMIEAAAVPRFGVQFHFDSSLQRALLLELFRKRVEALKSDIELLEAQWKPGGGVESFLQRFSIQRRRQQLVPLILQMNNIDAELEEFEIAGLTAQEAIAETAARMEVLRTQMHVDSATNGEGNRNILTLALAEGIEGRIVKQSLLAALTENGIRWSEDSTHFTPGVDKPLWLIEGFSPRRPADPFNVEGPKYSTSKAKPFPNVIRNAEVNPPHFDAKLAATSAICYHPVSKHPDSIVHPPRRPTTANSSYSSSTVPPRHPLLLEGGYGPSASFYLLLLLNPNSFIVLFHSINPNSTHDDDRETLGRQPLKDDHSQTERPAGDDPPAGRPLSDREDLREMTPSRTTTFQTEGPVGDDPLTGRPPSRPRRTGGKRCPCWTTTFCPNANIENSLCYPRHRSFFHPSHPVTPISMVYIADEDMRRLQGELNLVLVLHFGFVLGAMRGSVGRR
ncbi:hypothetical protein R3P38DRAFT_3184673 [Favolaschia claudopus]|uniref:Uncharacterized protein n=1 Tax=Favolaschia claudopus TaxID=2862362 RepID=A0AAW0C934_9AGAR